MAVRLLTYAGLLYQDLYRRAEVSRDGKLPPVLPVVFLPHGNLVSALILLENSHTLAELERALDALLAWVPGPGEHGLKRALGEWIRQVLLRGRFPEAILERTAELEEVRTMLEEQVQEWTRQWFEEGREEGREQGQRALLRRQAAWKFDAETAERLSDLLNGLSNPERLAEVGEWIIECETGAELLERAGSAGRAGDRDGRA